MALFIISYLFLFFFSFFLFPTFYIIYLLIMNYTHIISEYDTDTASSSTNTSSYFDVKRYSSDSGSSISTEDRIKIGYGSIVEEVDTISVKQNHCSTMGASVNLVNAMMGTGIIGLPLALHLCGFWLGLFFSVTIAYISCMTMHITILCGLKTQTYSLVSLCQTLIGRTGSQIVNFIIFFHTAGTAVSYYICKVYPSPLFFFFLYICIYIYIFQKIQLTGKILTVLGDTLPSLLALVFPNTPFFSSRRNVILAFGLLCVGKKKHNNTYF